MNATEFLEYEYGITLNKEKALIHPQMLIKAMESYAIHVKNSDLLDESYCNCVIPHYIIKTVHPLPDICDYCRKAKKNS